MDEFDETDEADETAGLDDLASAAVTGPVVQKPLVLVSDPGERLAASCIDAIAIVIVGGVLSMLGPVSRVLPLAGGIWLAANLLVELWTGYTIGLRLVKLRVADLDGAALPRWRIASWAVVRHLWLWVACAGILLGAMMDLGWLSPSRQVIYWSMMASRGLWLILVGGSLLAISGATRTLADLIAGVLVLSERRAALHEAQIRRIRGPGT